MKTIELLARVDENHRLTIEVPPEVRPGTVKITLAWPEEDPDDGSWQAAVAAIWEPDWSDPREDIYYLEDGKPECEPR
jgi:hypothetical protein